MTPHANFRKVYGKSPVWTSFWRSCVKHFRLPHCRLTPRLQGTPATIRINLTLPETSLCRWYYGSIFIQIFVVGSETHALWKRVRNGSSRSSEVIDFRTNNWKRLMPLWSSSITLVLSCPVSEMLLVFCWEQRPHPYSTRIFRVFP